MKKILFISVIAFICCFSLANSAKAAGTTCTITLNATTGHLWTYEVQFRVWDSWYSTWWSPAWSTLAPISVGTNYNFQIPLDVDPDCEARWVVYAYIIQYYNGSPYDSGGDTDGPISSEDYEAGNITLSVTIP